VRGGGVVVGKRVIPLLYFGGEGFGTRIEQLVGGGRVGRGGGSLGPWGGSLTGGGIPGRYRDSVTTNILTHTISACAHTHHSIISTTRST